MEQWSCYRGNSRHTGCNTGKGPEEGKVAWTFDTKEEISHSPALADNILYIPANNILYALNAADGTLLWQYEAPQIHSPAVTEEGVYFGAGDGKIYSLDKKSGKEKWQFKTGRKIMSTPAIVKENLYTGSTNKKFYCIDIHTGKEKWVFRAEDGIQSSPAVLGNLVFFGAGKTFYAIDIRKGKERWSYRTKTDIVSSPAIQSGTVYFSARYIYALDIINGARKWITEIEGDEATKTPVLSEDSLYIASKNYMEEVAMTGAVLYSISPHKGERQWAFFAWDNICPPAVAGNFLYIGAGDQKIYALDRRNGMQKWTCEVESKMFNPPVIDMEHIYFTGTDGKIYAVK